MANLLSPTYGREVVSRLLDKVAVGDRSAMHEIWKLLDNVPERKAASNATGSGGVSYGGEAERLLRAPKAVTITPT